MKKILSTILVFVLVLLFGTTAYANVGESENVTVNITEDELRTGSSSVIEDALRIATDEYVKHLTVNLPSGMYTLVGTLHIYSNTTLNLQADTVLVRGFDDSSLLRTGNTDEAFYGYDGYRNITVSGGVWDSKFASVTGMRFMHCDNVKLKNFTVKNICDSHHIEIGAANHMTLDGLTLTGYKRTKNTSGEAVQIDPVHDSKHFKYSHYLDDTPCQNITVKNCTFTDVFSGVGTRAGVVGSYFTNMQIVGNTFTNIKDKAICTYHYINSTIKNNTIKNATVGIFFEEYPTKNLTSKLYAPFAGIGKAKILTDVNTSIYGNTIEVKKRTSYAQSCGIGVYGGVMSTSTAKSTGLKSGSYLIKNLRIKKNKITVHSADSCGMELKYLYHSKINENTVTRSASSGNKGIALYHCNDNLLYKNALSGAFQDGIFVKSASKNNELASNTAKKMANYAVSVSADSKVTVNASNTLSATKGAVFISNKKIEKPKLAKKLTVTRKGRKTTVKWNKVKNASGYYIYRTKKKGGKYQLIATVNKNSKTTFSETTKKKYYYKVSPYKQYKNSVVIGDKKA